MKKILLPRRVFNSPLIKFVNFQDGTFVNLIKLNKPYKNGISFAVYETTNKTKVSNGLFKTIDQAEKRFNLIVEIASMTGEIRSQAVLTHNM